MVHLTSDPLGKFLLAVSMTLCPASSLGILVPEGEMIPPEVTIIIPVN